MTKAEFSHSETVYNCTDISQISKHCTYMLTVCNTNNQQTMRNDSIATAFLINQQELSNSFLCYQVSGISGK